MAKNRKERPEPRKPARKRKRAGLLPGTLVYTGVERSDKVRIAVIDYDEKNVTVRDNVSVEECYPFKDTPSVTWIDVDGIHDVETIEKLGKRYGLHSLILEDIVHTEQRPKIDHYDGTLFIVLKMLTYDAKQSKTVVEQVSLILGKNFVISFQEGVEGDVFDEIRWRIKSDKGIIRRMGADFLAYALIDSAVDHYFTVMDGIGERIETLEEELLSQPTSATLQAIHSLKREMILLRKAIWPLRDVIAVLERRDSPLITEQTRVYLRDVYDHTIRVVDSIETYRDLLSGMIDVYLSSVSNKLNEVMKVLTIISTIFIPLTFIAGVYGMNFEYFPELHWHYGYLFFWIIMFVLAGTMMHFFRKRGWL